MNYTYIIHIGTMQAHTELYLTSLKDTHSKKAQILKMNQFFYTGMPITGCNKFKLRY